MKPTHVLLVAALLPGTSFAQTQTPDGGKQPAKPAATSASARGPELDLPVQKATLKNGLRVVMNVDRSSPTVSICVTYDVGSRNEVPGRSGFAHLFEHMMFQGSRNVAKGDHFKWVSARGGSLNGTTSTDRTNYFETLPSNALALGLWLEADRMKTLAVTQENFENQRKVVQEEFRMRVTNSAYAEGLIKLNELAYGDYFPYAHSTIGSMEDLDTAELSWIRDFHSKYYAPNNAVLTIVGDFDADQAMSLVRSYFAGAQAVEVPSFDSAPPADEPTARKMTLIDKNAKTPGIYNGWVIPPFREKDHYALELASLLLGVGESSRLHQELVLDKSIARSAAAWTYDRRGPDLFTLRVLLTERADPAAVQKLVDAELERLATKKASEQELTKVRNRLISFFLFGLEGTSARARQLAEYELFWGDARLLSRELDNYLAISAEDIKRAVARYLVPARRTTVTVFPPSQAASAPDAKGDR